MTWARRVGLVTALPVLVSCGCVPRTTASLSPREQVFATERAFAQTMADRSLAAFAGFLSEEAVFFDGTTPLRGRKAVADAWAEYFAGPAPPFSWEPDQVEVLASGSLALSTGPVRDPGGQVVGRFNSIWRLEAPGTWRLVFDKGGPPTPGPTRGPKATSPVS